MFWDEYKVKETILATKMLVPFEVETEGRVYNGNAGDYLVLDRDILFILDGQVFHTKYEVVE
jgi:hypothetical protein